MCIIDYNLLHIAAYGGWSVHHLIHWAGKQNNINKQKQANEYNRSEWLTLKLKFKVKYLQLIKYGGLSRIVKPNNDDFVLWGKRNTMHQ